MEINLREIMNQLDEVVHKAKMDIDRLTREVAKLENIREDLFERLSREGNNEHLQRQLEDTENKIATLKKQRKDLQDSTTQKINEIRLAAEQIRDERIKDLQDRFQKIAEERDALRDEVIPDLQREIQDLTEKKSILDGQLLMLTSEINTLQRLIIEMKSLG
ncbi:MAG TPA: hypothetical protein PLB62_10290 [Candidatus Sumerlaeota bacterium]|nr:hypothetical protein [Candidatus Sumerlaeota bacterium]